MESELGYNGDFVLQSATLFQNLWNKETVAVPREFRHTVGQFEEDFSGDDM
jgi:hypothetical protein